MKVHEINAMGLDASHQATANMENNPETLEAPCVWCRNVQREPYPTAFLHETWRIGTADW